MTELRQRTDITLNEKQRKQEREDNEKQRLEIENKRRKAKGMELLEALQTEEELLTFVLPSASHSQTTNSFILLLVTLMNYDYANCIKFILFTNY